MRIGGILRLVLPGLFAAIGLAVAVVVAVDWFQGLDTWSWEQATCTITSSGAAEQPQYGEYAFEVSYRYSYRGVEHVGGDYRLGGQGFEQRSDAEVLASRYPVGSEVSCWVDPEDPGRAYLRRANLWRGLLILVPLLFVAVGVGAIWLVVELGRGREDGAEAATRAGEHDPEPNKPRAGLVVGGMFFLFGSFFLFGTGIAVPFFIRPALQVVLAKSWQPAACEILSSRVRTHPGEDGATYSIDVLYRYQIDGRQYRANRYQFMGGSSSGYDRRARIVEGLAPGTTTTCWVDPNDPHEAVIERGFTGDYLFGLMPLLFAGIGLGGLIFAVGVLRGARRDAGKQAWTAVADPSSWSWSGGPEDETGEAAGLAAARGPMVLEPTRGPLGKLGCTILAALFWNGFISIFVWHIAQEWQAGNPQWMPALILTPFVLIGLAILSGIPYSILALLNPRPRLHLSPGALRTSESAHLEWAFRGAGSRVRHLTIRLEATETRTRQTDSGFRIETSALDHPGIPVLDRGRELPLEYGAVDFSVPADTPPSTDGEPTIRWKLKLHGEIAYWPDVMTEYEVRVLPAEAARGQGSSVRAPGS